jgi:hypothetical protein
LDWLCFAEDMRFQQGNVHEGSLRTKVSVATSGPTVDARNTHTHRVFFGEDLSQFSIRS